MRNTYYQGLLPATVSLTLPSWFTPDISQLIDAHLQDSTVTFTVGVPFNGAWFTVPFQLPGATPSGTPYSVVGLVSYPNDPHPVNDTFLLSTDVLNSYDPNEKHTLESAILDPLITDSLTYVVHFQNDGNYPALNISVRDTISPSLDLSTFRFLYSKHPCTYTVDPLSREAVFYFANIQLLPSAEDPEASQGLFAYRIYEHANVGLQETILNTAYIYFDFNPAIITNTTVSVNQALGVEELAKETISLYPNPASDVVRFAGAEVQSLQVVDLAGKVIVAKTDVANNELSLAGIDNGLYLVTVTTETGVQTLRLTVEK